MLHITYISAHVSADEDEYLNQSSAHLGEIRISIYRVQPVESVLFQPGSNFSGHGKVHERSKKAVTHCVSCVDCILLSAASNAASLQIRTGSEDSNKLRYPRKVSGWRDPACYIHLQIQRFWSVYLFVTCESELNVTYRSLAS